VNARLVVVLGFGLWAGATLVLARTRLFARRSYADRIRPYTPLAAPGLGARSGSGRLWSAATWREAIGPTLRDLGERGSRALGIGETLDVRLARVHSTTTAAEFRIRQSGWALGSLVTAIVVVLAVDMPAGMGLLVLLGAPVLAFLLTEQQAVKAAQRWQTQVRLELPVMSEQLAMLLAAGYSLTSALSRLATRGDGACARDLARVCRRIRHGLSEIEALREWQALASVAALDRLVAVLALNREASDLGRLISDEARSIRRDAHRDLIEAVERRSQQVWVPVTVATLLPGAVFLMIPFLEALRFYGG
jgi:tight adherence protein C